jgi:DNA-binding transcriptional LysR family regulator
VELRDLDYFLACCEAGSFTAAARSVHIVQSAMSSAIARLEHELDAVLFDRSVTPIAVTAQGAALRAAAGRITDAVAAARDEVAAAAGVVRGPVVVGGTLATGPLDLAAVLGGLRSAYPEVTVRLRQSSAGSAGNLRAVLDGSVDIALAAGRPPGPGVVSYPLVSEPLVLVCGPGHPLAGRPAVTAADLAAEPVLRFPPGWGVAGVVDEVLGAAGPADGAMEVADYGLMARLVAGGFGVTLMPRSAAAGRPGVAVVPVTDDRLRWRLAAVISAARRPSAAAGVVLAALRAAVG